MPEDYAGKALQILESLYTIKNFSRYLERKPVNYDLITEDINELLTQWDSLPVSLKKQPFYFLEMSIEGPEKFFLALVVP